MSDWQDIVSKALPTELIYKDLVQPAAQQIGQIAGNVVKVARLIVAPIDGLAAWSDRE